MVALHHHHLEDTMTKPTKRDALKKPLRRCIDHFGHCVDLARIAAAGPEPRVAAGYLLGMIKDMEQELEQLRALAGRRPRKSAAA